MAEDVRLRFARLRWLVTKLETNHTQIDEMMFLHIQDGLGAMAYGQYGGSTPDPTGRTVVAPDGSLRVWNRDNVAETDRNKYWADLAKVEKLLEGMDAIRRTYMTANRDMWLRADPTDYCRVHWFVWHREDIRHLIPKRVVGDLCKECNTYRLNNDGKAPEPLDVEYFDSKGHWPAKRIDPKTGKPV